MAGKGGATPGAGRKKGIPNKASIARQEKVAATGITPLDYMLAVMRDPTATKWRRDDMAKAVAPYVHPRLSTIEHNNITPARDTGEIYARLVEILAATASRGSGGPDRPVRH